MKEVLSQKNLQHLYLDITDGMLNLKRFLKLRDSRDEFQEVKAAGRVGLPCLLVDGEKLMFDESDIKDLLSKL